MRGKIKFAHNGRSHRDFEVCKVYLMPELLIVHNWYLSDSAKTQKAEGRVVIHHLNDDQKALVIRYFKKDPQSI